MHNLAVLFQHQGQYKVADDMNERALKEKEKEKEKIPQEAHPGCMI